MFQQHGFDFQETDAVAANLDDAVLASEMEKRPVRQKSPEISSKIEALFGRIIRRQEPGFSQSRIVPIAQSKITTVKDDLPSYTVFHRLALIIAQRNFDTPYGVSHRDEVSLKFCLLVYPILYGERRFRCAK